MDSTDKQMEAKIAAFENDQEPAHLQEALNLVETATQDAHAGDVEARKEEIALWLLLFAALDRSIDPKWDPKDVPETGVIPPPSHGVAYPSGIDPSAIANPEVRAQYEQALKASKDYAEWYRVQLLLRRVDERAMVAVERRLNEIYTGSLADPQEFEGVLAASPVTESRKERLRALVPR